MYVLKKILRQIKQKKLKRKALKLLLMMKYKSQEWKNVIYFTDINEKDQF